ncbi:MAG: response regulator [Desulfobacterales bacterium]|nr:response regulator [Desulfobacterales bacterium]
MCNVLVIDDDSTVSKIIKLLLAKIGCLAEIAGSGAEGIRKFDSTYFDVVITDMQMPEMDGNEVAMHIRNSERHHTPVIGISGNPHLFERNNFDLLLSKPFSKEELVGSITSLVNFAGNAA